MKFTNANSGKISKIYERYGLFSWDSLGLCEPFYKKMVLSLKYINIYNIISFKGRGTPNESPEGKSLEIELVSQNRLNAIKK